jgi:hypothetical protein
VTPADFPIWHYRGRLSRVIDGDTAVLEIELWHGFRVTFPVQVAGYRLSGEAAEAGAADLTEILTGRDLYLVAEEVPTDSPRAKARIFVQLLPGAPLVDVAELMRGNVDSARATRKPKRSKV